MTDNIDFEERLKQVAENPDLKEIANLTVNLLSEQATQIQTNVLQAVLINTILEIIVEHGLITYEDFQGKYQTKLQQADEDLIKVFKEAQEQADKEALGEDNETTEQKTKEDTDD